MHRLVTFLGTGNYQPVCYRFGERTARETCWVGRALQELLEPHPTETVVLATDAAWEKNGEGLRDSFREAGLADPLRIAIPEGRNEQELWAQFEIIKEQVRVAPEAIVTVDITHAFRHQPFFTSGILTFVRSIDETPPEVRVVYGAFEMKEQDESGATVSPVLELTPFVELLDWTHDLVLFLKSGRLGRLIRRVREPGRTLHERWQNGVRLASALEAFARDLQTIRTGSLLLGRADDRGRRSSSSARQLLEAVERARDDVANQLPPLADVLDRVDGMARELAFEGDSLSGESGRRALLALTDVYLRMGRYIEAITTLREGRITAWSAPAAARPGLPGFDEDERRYTENRLWRQAEPNEQEAIARIRNDLDHAGYRRGPLGAADLIENIRKQRDAFARLSPPPRPQENRIFVNISNHPSADWPEEQHRAALDLAGRVEDIPFPEVGPDWSLRRLEDEADRIAGALPPETTHAMVQGEFTLTAALVRRLQQKGIRCLAATTERRVERTEDGREVRSFRFVRFREYPRLA